MTQTSFKAGDEQAISDRFCKMWEAYNSLINIQFVIHVIRGLTTDSFRAPTTYRCRIGFSCP